VRLIARRFGIERRGLRGLEAVRAARRAASPGARAPRARLHLTRGQRQLDGEAPRHDLGVPFGALPLACQAPHLARHLVDQIVQTLQIARRLLEPTLRRAPTISIQADPGRLLEQLPPIVGSVREQRVDHLALDDDARPRSQTRAPQQVGDVAEPARRAIQEVVAVSRTREPARDHDFAEGNGEGCRPRSRSAARPRRR
jgi:hypothetical protein